MDVDARTRSLVRKPGAPRLAVIGGGVVATHALPAAGEVVIGRDAGCDVRIDDRSLSRRHARLRIAERITIEDLGSSNGTFVAGQRLEPGAPRPITVDEIVTIGGIGIVVQQNAPLAPQRTLWGHGYFELRLAEECTRAARVGTTFGLLRVRSAERDAAELLSEAVRDIDVVGIYAPHEWEVLLLDISPAAAAELADRIRAAIPGAAVGLAMFPADGQDAWSLGSCAATRRPAEPRRVTGPAEPRPAGPALAAIGPMRGVLALADRVAVGDISVLIVGETGAGKEVVADHIHARSPRSAHPLVKLNCAAMPEQLLESELFGHEKGAFTGAVATKPGLLEQAEGGSVFLDEIGELPLATQAKLLRVLEQREILRVGGLKPRAIDVRFLAATHRDLEAAIAAERFREDLYFRIAGVTLQIPPLRERLDEILPLAERFAARAAAALSRPTPVISPAARELLRGYRWPGNVRELRNVIERATLLCDGTIDVGQLPGDRMSRPAVAAPAEPSGLGDVRVQAGALERQAIESALARTGGNQTEAARQLGISRRTLTNKLNQHGFDRPRKRR
ncbi:MAG TPA: sigma 54-interacting transcriptional regulator [Kofleriaceae bacterium]|nr:sigma 54-interacting transcriptional regulator [Kofleriaceae bacterium]